MNKNQAGFSLIELLLVVVIIGVVAAIAIPMFSKAIIAAENSSAIAHLSMIRQSQAQFYVRNSRFANMSDLRQQNLNLGTIINAPEPGCSTPPCLRRGKYSFTLQTAESDLAREYVVLATRQSSSDIPYIFSVNQSGIISRVAPAPGEIGN